mgnify:CR=1 FL=1
MSTPINPGHYVGLTGLECHEAQRAQLGTAGMIAYWRGCAIKYLWRCWRKGGVQDIKKAIRCLQFLLAEMEEPTHERNRKPAGEGVGPDG